MCLATTRMDIIRTHLDGNADAVEFCPDDPFQNILAAATYTLQESPQPSRIGSISLFSIQDKLHLNLLHQLKTSGVFDIKWIPGEGKKQPNLLQAGADGNMTMYCLDHPETVSEDEMQTHGGIKIKELASENISCSSMCLTLDWDEANTSRSNIAVGLSEGSVSVVTLREAQMQMEHSWQAHGFEVWAVAYDSHRSNVLYSGADDCNFCGWDMRECSSQPIFRNTKSHRMGVCSIRKNPQCENSVITGSYDECLRLWDLRLMERPVLQESLGLGGGVWKLKFHPSIGNLVLAACMHNGFAIVSIENDGMKFVEEYKEHDSLAYGADWFKGDLYKLERHGVCVPESSTSRNSVDKEENLWHNEEFAFENVKHPSVTSGPYDDGSIPVNECMVGENSCDNGPPNVESAHQRTMCSLLVATCSFYDKALHIWKPKFSISDASFG